MLDIPILILEGGTFWHRQKKNWSVLKVVKEMNNHKKSVFRYLGF